jgi:hypothetical protein
MASADIHEILRAASGAEKTARKRICVYIPTYLGRFVVPTRGQGLQHETTGSEADRISPLADFAGGDAVAVAWELLDGGLQAVREL